MPARSRGGNTSSDSLTVPAFNFLGLEDELRAAQADHVTHRQLPGMHRTSHRFHRPPGNAGHILNREIARARLYNVHIRL
jgi:hypothetical protein